MTDDPRPEGSESAAGAASDSSEAQPSGRSAAAAARRARRIGGVAASRPAPTRPKPAAEPVGLEKADPVEQPTRVRPRPATPDVPDHPDETYAPSATPAWLRWLPAGVLGAGVVVMAVLVLVFSHGVWWAKPSSGAARDKVLAAARSCLIDINTYDYRSLDAYERRALACTTGSLTGDLRKAIDSIVKVRAPQLKASQQIQVHEIGIQSNTAEHWTLLVFAQVNLKSVTYPNGSRTPYAAEIEMTKSHGKWLVSRETTLGSTAGQNGGSPSSAAPSSPSGGASSSPSAGPSSPAASSSKR